MPANRQDGVTPPVKDRRLLPPTDGADEGMLLTAIEMPEMDGYVLTRKVKWDARFRDIRKMLHSSMSTDANPAPGRGIGADACVAKFEPLELAAVLEKMLGVHDNRRHTTRPARLPATTLTFRSQPLSRDTVSSGRLVQFRYRGHAGHR